ncbi:5-(carboxyamino)imidazole ribonucleotide synthase [Botrimarina sp.]|uniref:5-(carboxyamino)imidazole ribonucleotide synthase n=1 Tax=Botrimarina sp. TaxID=2795802 RepID=UPI0032EBD084
MTDSPPILPGATLGVFGGGQLGRMFVHAAQRMGYRVHVYSAHHGSPAGRVADQEHVGRLGDLRSVASFALSVDVATLEFENVPTESIKVAERHTPVRPGSHVLHTTQHRVREKRFLAAAGVPVGPFEPVDSAEMLHAAVEKIGLPAVLKTAQMGYDGKGQRVLQPGADLDAAWEAIGPGDCILEAFVDFSREVSMLVARAPSGELVLYGPIENDHAHHILDVSVLPAPDTSPETAERAAKIATAVAERLDAIGLICVEMFQRPDGSLLVNEIAPRPHNSGHLTIEGCRTSQFEQQVRAVCGLPLGSPESLRPAAMANLLGDQWFASDGSAREPDWIAALHTGAHVHLYGKESARAGRKMGHLTLLSDTPEHARAAVRAARSRI